MRLNFWLLLIFVMGCTSGGNVNSNAPQTIKQGLTVSEAQERSRVLSEVVYELSVTVSPRDDKFSGTLKAGFNLSDVPKDLRFDFVGGEVEGVKVNKAPVTTFQYDGTGLYLPESVLVRGLNVVEINYRHAYSNDGRGLHRYKDTIDGETYMYTDFEPFDANRFFPCFDQPDLKATYTLTVNAPKNWQVVSTAMEQKKKIIGENRQWKFPTTSRISTYLFSMHAGPYRVFQDRFGKTPLRLMARKSFAKYVDPTFWFKTTKQGLGFFNKYFDYEYPFGKYDQIIVPEFNSGAMENVAAVTFSERYMSRSKPTRDELLKTSNVILHEMAHMWFGNIVTMKWWNDLWLNESFATYMASLAQSEATEFKEAWLKFYKSDKMWAYWEDQLITTHPIEAVAVNSTSEAKANFDGITYGKGASVMKQLSYYIGKDKFQKGVQNYMRVYGFKNATLPDFINSLQEHTKNDLSLWSKVWLREAGLDSMIVKLECDGEKVTTAKLDYASATSSQRPHALQLGVFEKQTSMYKVANKIDVVLNSGTLDVTELVGQKCPGFLFPNYGDQAYIKTYFDSVSLEKMKSEINLIPDPMVRLMAWQNLWQMVLDQKLPPQNYINAAIAQIASEKDLLIVDNVLQNLVGTDWSETTSALYFLPPSPMKNELIVKVEGLFLKQVDKSKPGSDEFKLWAKMLARVAQSPGALVSLQEQLKGNTVNDPDLRWQMLITLCRYDFPGSKTLLAKESAADKSERGVRAALSCAAAYPDAKVKEEWLAKLLEPKSKMPIAQAKSIMKYIFLPGQEKLFEPHVKTFFDVVANRDGSRDDYFLEEFSGYLMPLRCSTESSERLKNFANHESRLDYPVRRELLMGQDKDLRCAKIRDLAQRSMMAN